MRLVVGIDKEATRYRAYLDGVDITDTCFDADDEKGVAYCYKTNPETGSIIYSMDVAGPIIVKHTGKVELRKA